VTSTNHSGPRLAIWGTFDVANFGDQLFPRVFAHEIERRLPTAEVRPFSPLGHLHPVPLDGGLVVEPLGPWSAGRLEQLARESDLVAIGGGEIIHSRDDLYSIFYDTAVEEAERLRPSAFFIDGLGTELESHHPTAWHSVGIPFDFEGDEAERIRSALKTRAYVSVRDHLSRERLLRTGVEREIAVAPDSAFLVARILPERLLEKRLAYLRGIDSYPGDGEPPLVVQANRAFLPHVDALGPALAAGLEDHPGVPIVLLEAGPCHGDGEFADAIAPFITGRVHRMPEGATVEDVVAAIASARGFVGSSLHGNIVSFAYGVPSAILNLLAYSKLDGFAALVQREEALVTSPIDIARAVRGILMQVPGHDDVRLVTPRIDAHFDALAEIAERSAAERVQASPPAARSSSADALASAKEREAVLQRAFEARGRRLVEQRLRLVEQVEALAVGDARLANARGEIGRLKESRMFRYTQPLRTAYASLRGKIA